MKFWCGTIYLLHDLYIYIYSLKQKKNWCRKCDIKLQKMVHDWCEYYDFEIEQKLQKNCGQFGQSKFSLFLYCFLYKKSDFIVKNLLFTLCFITDDAFAVAFATPWVKNTKKGVFALPKNLEKTPFLLKLAFLRGI